MFNFESKRGKDQGSVGENSLERMKPIDFELLDRSSIDHSQISKFKEGSLHIDYFTNSKEGDDSLSAGYKTYKISEINEKSKYTDKLRDCTSVVAIGVDKVTGKNVSFISHQDPENILKDVETQRKFEADLRTRLDEFVDLCKPDTVDINIIGGNKNIKYKEPMKSVNFDALNPQEAFDFYDYQESGFYERYRRSIKFLDKIIFEKLHKHPFVVLGPNANVKDNNEDFYHNNDTDIYLDTQSRKLYAVREKNEILYNAGFSAEEIDEIVKQYK